MLSACTSSTWLAVTGALWAGAMASDRCYHISNPSSDHHKNTRVIQTALDEAAAVGTSDQRSCVSISGGDYPVQRLMIGSNTVFRISEGTRLMNVQNVTRVAVVHVNHSEHVTIEGGGSIHGSASEAWQSWSVIDNRMSPYGDDGVDSFRTHLLLITSSHDVTVRGNLTNGGGYLKIHNSSDWTFRMDNSSDVYVEGVHIYGDRRFPNNDGFDPQSCTNVTLVHSAIDVADDGEYRPARVADDV